MSLKWSDLRPGDFILFYGWNGVAVMQAIAKSLGRLTFLPLIRDSAIALGTLGNSTAPVAALASKANCNHAAIIGDIAQKPVPTQDVEQEYDLQIQPGEGVTTREDGDSTILQITAQDDSVREVDITNPLNDNAFAFKEIKLSGTGSRKKYKAVYVKAAYIDVPRLCHSTGGGCFWTLADGFFKRNTGEFRVFRFWPQNSADLSLASDAATIAGTWAHEWTGSGVSQYSIPKALMAGFGRCAYGDKAAKRVLNYRRYKAEPDGPPSDQVFIKQTILANKTNKKEWFCSMFAIACFQAATANDDQVKQYLPLDARYTSPMSLHGYLSNSPSWKFIGTVS